MTPFVLVITSCLSTGGDCARVPMAQGLLELECNHKSMFIVADWKHPTGGKIDE